MLESLASDNYGLTNSGAIVKKLQEVLKGEKFLLVLDDVWDPNAVLWECLRNELQRIGDPSKSVILITTRITEVANNSRANHIHKLKGLSEDDGWTLLCQKACISMSSSQEYTKFEEIGRKIVNKCAGVPLAIKAMGPLLQSRKDPRDWEHILTTELNDLPHDKENYILPSLRLSYNHLPSVSVKQCFAYCAIFPKDYRLQKHTLISIWMAHGFLQRTNMTAASTMEDIGEVYFAHLLYHSFLEEELDEIFGTKSYKMHDLVHDLAVDVFGKDLFVWKVKVQQKEASSLSHVRNLTIDNFEIGGETTPKFTIDVRIRKVRTIHFRGGVFGWDSIISARYMRVLIVANLGLTDIPNDIGQLIHLRYLDLSLNDILILPDSICKLYQLQTLRLEGNRDLQMLPRELYKLRNLRHIDHISEFPYQELSASRGLGLLTNLQTLPALELWSGDERWTIDELESLNQIKGVVEISGLEHVKNREEAIKAGLGSKGGIIRLVLKWSFRYEDSNNEMMNIDEDVLGGLELPCNIKDLCVRSFMGLMFPSSWIKPMVVSNLSRVILVDCKRCKQLPTLGQLPSLKYLKVVGFLEVESIGNEFYHENTSSNVVFEGLKELYIERFERLTSWMPFGITSSSSSSSAFPILEELSIEDCPKLERVPALHFQSLKVLQLKNLGGTQPLDIIKYSQGLKELSIFGIDNPEEEEWSVPQELFSCSNLEMLSLVFCENLKSIGAPMPNGEMTMMMPSLSLKSLEILCCPTLTCIPTAIVNCKYLVWLDIRHCENLKSIGVPILNGEITTMMPSLKKLKIENCPTLTCIPTGTSLESLEISHCKNLKSIGIHILNGEMFMMSYLKNLVIENCPAVSVSCIPTSTSTSAGKCAFLWILLCGGGGCLSTGTGMDRESDVTDYLRQLKRLEELTMVNAGQMMMMLAAKSIPHLDSLRKLEIGGFKDEEEITKFVSQIKSTPHSLRHVKLRGWPKVKTMPEQLQHLLPSSTLEQLSVFEFGELEQLPEWIGNLSSLKTLNLFNCNKLKYLPSKQAMLRLSGLSIQQCPQLNESQWPNISHIPFIWIDGSTIQDLH